MSPKRIYREEGMRRLKILLADDHSLMVEAIALALADEEGIEIVGSAENGSQVLPLVERTRPDLVVLDLRMPGMDGLTCIKHLRERFPEVRTVVLSGIDSDEMIDAALRVGANAFISKTIDPAELAAALRRAAEEPVGQAIGRAKKRLDSAVAEKGLTERELAVLQALAQGQSNKEIARALWLAEQTVKFHLTNIYRKLDVRSRTEAVHWAYRHGLLESSTESPLSA
jgi:two-component system, NarL family, response regulator LiaR